MNEEQAIQLAEQIMALDAVLQRSSTSGHVAWSLRAGRSLTYNPEGNGWIHCVPYISPDLFSCSAVCPLEVPALVAGSIKATPVQQTAINVAFSV